MWNDKKYLPYSEELWKNMPKHSKDNAKRNLETYAKHCSAYIEKLY